MRVETSAKTVGRAGLSPGQVMLERVHEIGPAIAAAAPEGDKLCRLPDSTHEAMQEAGIFAMAFPRDWGGPELDPLEQMRVIEAIGEYDASASWCAMIGCDGGYWTAYLDQATARSMYPDITVSTAGSGSPSGRAVKVKGGWMVSGRWPFSSGCHHATWLGAGCLMVDESGDFAKRPDGRRRNVRCFLPRGEVEILDTWHTTGLAGSGSADFTIADYFVPEERSFSLHDLKVQRDGPLYQAPFSILLKASASPFGVARQAINALIEAANRQVARGAVIGGEVSEVRFLRDEAYVQDAVGRAEAMLGSSRAYLYEIVGQLWETLKSGDMPDRQALARFNLANINAFAACTEAVQLVYKARGGRAIYQDQPLDRCLRDIQTMNQHTFVSLRGYQMAGRALLGMPGDVLMVGTL